jgi:tetratricopeptide (TPR) repeat protein
VAAMDPERARGYLMEALGHDPGDAAVSEQLDLLNGIGDPVSEEDEVLIVDDDADAFERPTAETPRFSLGPRETSLATALEGAEEPDLMFADDDDDEPELVHEEEPELELSAEPDEYEHAHDEEHGGHEDGLEQHGDEDEELPEAVEDALEEADFYLAQKLVDEARDVITEALASHPGHPALLRKLRELGGDADDASEPADAALEDHSFELAQKLADQQAGTEAQGPVAVEQVLQQFKEGVRRSVEPGDTATHYDLGIAYMEMGLHTEAIEEFKLCLDSGETQRTAHTMIGLSYVAKGEMQPGIDHFKLALQSPAQAGEQEIDLWFEIGNAYELLGTANDALVWYEKVEEQNPEFRDVATRIERLGMIKSPAQETDEIDAMFDNMILKE